MNSEKPLTPGEELEIRITALVLGELSPDEATALRAQLSDNPVLQSLHARLARAFDLLRAAAPLSDLAEESIPATLSSERRERLFQHFKGAKTSRPKVIPITRRRWTWLAPLSWAASFTIAIGILLWQVRHSSSPLAYTEAPEFEATEYAGEKAPEGRATNYRYYGEVLADSDRDKAVSLDAAVVNRPEDSSKLAYQVPPPAPSAPASATPLYFRGRGIEEPNRSLFDGGQIAQNSPATTKPPARPESLDWSSQASVIRNFSGTESKSEFKLYESESFGARALANQPATPPMPSSGPVQITPPLAINGRVSDRESTLGAKVEGQFAEKKIGETDLAELATVAKSPKERKEAEQALEQLRMQIPGAPGLGDVPVTGGLFRGEAPALAAPAKHSTPAPAAKPSAPAMMAGRMGGTADSKDSKPAASATPQQPEVAGRVIAGEPFQIAGDEPVAKEKSAAGVGGGAGAPGEFGGLAISGPKPRPEPALRAPGEMPAGGAASTVDSLAAGQRGEEAIVKDPRGLDRADASNPDPASIADVAERERVRRSLQAAGKSETAAGSDSRRLAEFDELSRRGGRQSKEAAAPQTELWAEDYSTMLDVNSAAEGSVWDGLVITPRPEAQNFSVETRSKRLSPLDPAQPVKKIEDGFGIVEGFDASGTANWYFKQDGTLAKLGKDAGVNPVTGGNRSGSLAINSNAIDALLFDTTGAAESKTPAKKSVEALEDRTPEKPIILSKEVDVPIAAPTVPPPVPQPEIATSANAFSTFSLNVSDVAFKLAAASLEQGRMPDAGAIRSEEFINAFDYRDPEPAAAAPLAFASERARYPFAHNRDLLRLSVKTAAVGRQPGRPLNLVLLVDNSGSMERADRVRILQESLRVLAAQLQPQDKLSIITFARTPHLWIDGVPGNQAAEATGRVGEITPQGGTNLSGALDLAYETARKHYQVANINRVVLLTDGAANLGNVNPTALKQKVEAQRKQGIALDCFGVGWEGYNDDLLEQLSRNGDGRYGFINSPDAAATEFAGQLAGALRVAASDVKVQVEFNPKRVTAYRQIGYAKHQLTKEQFRDNTVDAAEIGAAESGNALYVVEVNPRGEGDLATVRARFKVPGTSDYREHEWTVPFSPNAPALEQSTPAMRLAATASAFSEWLAGSPYAAEITSDQLLGIINGVPQTFGNDPRPQKLEWMIRQAKSVSGR
jgi:Mg-chelatase subunit ChlD